MCYPKNESFNRTSAVAPAPTPVELTAEQNAAKKAEHYRKEKIAKLYWVYMNDIITFTQFTLSVGQLVTDADVM